MATNTLNRATRAGADVASDATDEARDVASTAAQRTRQLAETAREETSNLAQDVRERASEVTGEVFEQGRNVVEDARQQVEAKAAAGTQQLATAFRNLGSQTQALTEGRPEDAPDLLEYACRAADGFYGAADRLYGLSQDIQEEGVGKVLDDLQSFARRRPGAFLLGAAVAGFGLGRAVKAEKERRAADEENQYEAAQTRQPLAASTSRANALPRAVR